MKKAILLVAYGAGNPLARAGLLAFEKHCRERFLHWPVRWAYSSLLIRERIARQKQKSDSVRKALMRLYYEKFRAVAIQPLQTICGREYEEIKETVEDVSRETGLQCSLGKPLLNESGDAWPLARAIIAHMPKERNFGEDVVFMGHGARHPAVRLYEDLGVALALMDQRTHLGTMSGRTALEDILPRLTSPVVWLLPLFAGIGQHALRDMAGDGGESWKSRIEARGHKCLPVLRGMAEYEQIGALWLDNLGQAIASLAPAFDNQFFS